MADQYQGNLYEDEDVLDLLEKLKTMVVEARSVLMTGNCIVPRDQMLRMLTLITNNLPSELKQAKWILSNQRQLQYEARSESDRILAEAEERAVMMIHENQIYKQARLEAEELVQEAEQEVQQMRQMSVKYVEARLEEVNDCLMRALHEIHRGQAELRPERENNQGNYLRDPREK